MAKKKAALGRGLGALIDDSKYEREEIEQVKTISEIDIEHIEPNPFQPRKEMSLETLEELAASIKQLGIIQPITVSRKEDGNYQLISGERRFRAAKMAGLNSITAYIRQTDDQGLLELALVENIQREDLNPIEIAISYQRLIEECKLTQETLSEHIGKNRSTIANYLRLLKLPAEIQVGLRDKKIMMGHAKALLNISNEKKQIKSYLKVVNENLSVRKTEELVKKINNPPQKKSKEQLEEEYIQLQNHLTDFFGTKIDFKRTRTGKGKIIIPFKSDEELERIIGILDKPKSQ